MCTRVLWAARDDSVIVGRNMDFHLDLYTNLWVQPRGVRRDDGVGGALSWRARYGSVIATAFDIVSVDGLNEAGLAGHLLWLAEAEYGTPDPARPQLTQAVWLQYLLDNFATVAEAVSWIDESDVQVVQMDDPTGGSPPALHLALEDATGDSAVVEYVDGHAKVYHDRAHTVMTNSPTFSEQLALASRVTGLGGDEPLPGSTRSRDRFARAAYYLARLRPPRTPAEGVAAMFSVIRNVAQPFRAPEPGHPEVSQTTWQTVADLTGLRYIFESTTRPNIVWVDLADLDFAEGARQLKLNLVGELAVSGGLAGDVSDRFEDAGPITFLSLAAERELAEAAERARRRPTRRG